MCVSEGFKLIGEIREKCLNFRMEKNLEEKDVVIELSSHTGCLIEQIPNNEIQGLSRELCEIGIEKYLEEKGFYEMKATINWKLDEQKKPYDFRQKKGSESEKRPAGRISG